MTTTTTTTMGGMTTMTDNELIARLRERGCWYDYADKSTWFKDDALTVPALQPEDVRYVKNKVGPGYMKVERTGQDTQGRYYVECGDNFKIYGALLADKPLPLNDLEALEQRFMRDMGMFTK